MGKKIVIKVGSSTLTTSESSIDRPYLDLLIDQVAHIKAEGWEPIIVTSAAIASGLGALGIKQRPQDMPSLQAAASVGAGVLAREYASSFARHDILSSIVLLTRRDTADRTAYLHARDTVSRLLSLGVVPIVNENDTVSVEQIRFGDNDTLAALVACLIEADLVVLLSDVEGLYSANPHTDSSAVLIEQVDRIDKQLLSIAGGSDTTVGSGGMSTKLKAALVLMAAGIPMVVCNGRTPEVLEKLVAGERVGTLFAARRHIHEITPRKLWIALGDSSHGAVVVDDGAKTALISKGSSLLTVGVSAVEGRFDAGDIIDIKDREGQVFARGKVAFSSDELELACGRSREAIESNRLLRELVSRPLVHRDELVVFE